MLEFSIKKILLNHFNVDNNKGELGIGYEIITVHDLMVKIGLMANFKHQVLQWDDTAVPTKDPRILIG